MANQKLNDFFDASVPLIGRLYGRWMDEKEYEDINDYAVPFKGLCEKHNVKIEKMTKRPFGFVFTIEGAKDRFHLSCNSRQASLKVAK